ncbi:MAG: hypothetical protein GX050_09875 [Firmicutes bacterium]|nr:hypothetical protein [Bacillota bacterium]
MKLKFSNASDNSFLSRIYNRLAGGVCNRSRQRRLIILFLLFSLLPLLLLESAAYRYVKNSITDKISQYSQKGLVHTGTLLDLLFQKYEELSIDLQADLENQMLIKDYINQESSLAAVQLSKEFEDTLSYTPIARCLILGSPDDQSTYLNAGLNSFATTYTKVKQSPVYQEALSVPGQISWGVVEHDLAMVRIINDLTTGEPLCVFVAIFDGSKISQLINTNFNASSPMNDSPSLILVNAQGRILSSPFPEELGSTINEQFASADISNVLKNNNVAGAFSTRLQHNEQLVTYHYLPSKDWYLLSFEPHAYLFKEIEALRTPVCLFILLLSSLLAVLFSYAFSANSSVSRNRRKAETVALAAKETTEETINQTVEKITHQKIPC